MSHGVKYLVIQRAGSTDMFTAKDEVDNSQATYETANSNVEQSKFLNHDKVRYINHPFYDHTKAKGGPSPEGDFSQRLSGNDQEKIGLTRSISVMPGDKLSIEVFAKYYQPIPNDPSAFGQLMYNIINSLAVPAGTIIDGAGYALSANNSLPFVDGLNKSGGDPAAPKAYLNWIVFNRDYIPNMDKSGFKRITANSKEDGTDVDHAWLKPDGEIVIDEPGFVYIWLSNENETPVEVYFDDFKVEHTKSPVIQQEEYYPFGLSFNQYNRESSVSNEYKYNGKELQDELNLGWLDYGARMSIPEIGRWISADPLADERWSFTPYNFVQNNPLIRVDQDGMLDDYAMDTKTGDIKLIKVTDDEKDKLVDAKDNSTVIVKDVDKGLLNDGSNIKQDGLETTNVKGGVQLAFDISKYTSEEIVGVEYQNTNGGKLLEIRPYEGQVVSKDKDGFVTNVKSGASQEIKPTYTSKDGSFTGTPTRAFHTHPGHPDARPGGDIGKPIPSYADREIARQNYNVNGVNIPFYILGKIPATYNNVTGTQSVYKYDKSTRSVPYKIFPTQK